MLSAETHQHVDAVTQIHVLLALGIMAAYLSVPFTALRRLPVTRLTQVSGSLFFLTCAVTHLGIAVGFHGSAWMMLNDFVQLVSVVLFIWSLSRQVGWALKRKEERDRREGRR